jgi:hypothetical protein
MANPQNTKVLPVSTNWTGANYHAVSVVSTPCFSSIAQNCGILPVKTAAAVFARRA